jgi:hypothetical protein
MSWKKAITTVLPWAIGACGSSKSSGLLADHLVCSVASTATIAADTGAEDNAYSGLETAVVMAGTSGTTPSMLQSISVGTDQSVWGVVLKLVAPSGADGDVNVALTDDLSEEDNPTSINTLGSQTISAAQIGTSPTWLLVDFGAVVQLGSGTVYDIALTTAYAPADQKPVSWVTWPGSGLSAYTVDPISGLGSETAKNRQGTYLLETCQ